MYIYIYPAWDLSIGDLSLGRLGEPLGESWGARVLGFICLVFETLSKNPAR